MIVAIVEDNKEYSQTLLSFIERFEKENNIAVEVFQYYTGCDFLDECQKNEFNIVFMDIMMPGIDGMETAKRLRSADNEISIVFVTNMAQYAINGYEVGAIDFIVKPIDYQNFALKFQKVLNVQSKKTGKNVFIKTSEGLVNLDTKDIIYGETYGHYVKLHTKSSIVTSRASMKEILNLLGLGFRQCSKSYFVNLSYVRKITTTSLFVGVEGSKDTEILLSRKLKDNFISYLIENGD